MGKKDDDKKDKKGKYLVCLSGTTPVALNNEIIRLMDTVDDFKLKDAQYQAFANNYSVLIGFEGKIDEEEED